MTGGSCPRTSRSIRAARGTISARATGARSFDSDSSNGGFGGGWRLCFEVRGGLSGARVVTPRAYRPAPPTQRRGRPASGARAARAARAQSARFTPTDVMPLAHWAKLTTGLESGASLVILGLVIARAVNILA